MTILPTLSWVVHPSPPQCVFFLHSYLPVTDSGVAHPRDFAQPPGLRAKRRMAKKTANVFRGFIIPYIEKDQAVSLVQQHGMIKAVIEGEKGWLLQSM